MVNDINVPRELGHIRELLKKELEIVDLRFKSTADALNLKTAQDDIHFGKLNNEWEHLKEMKSSYVSIDTHNGFVKEIKAIYDAKIEVIIKEHYNTNEKLNDKITVLNRFMWSAIAIIGFLQFVGIGLVIKYLVNK